MTNAKTLMTNISKIARDKNNVVTMGDLFNDYGYRIVRKGEQIFVEVQSYYANGMDITLTNAIADLNTALDGAYKLVATSDTYDYLKENKKIDMRIAGVEVQVMEWEESWDAKPTEEPTTEVEPINTLITTKNPQMVYETIEPTVEVAPENMDTFTIYNCNYNMTRKVKLPIAVFKNTAGFEMFDYALDQANKTGGYEFTLQRANGKSSRQYVAKKMAMDFLEKFIELGLEAELNTDHPSYPKSAK